MKTISRPRSRPEARDQDFAHQDHDHLSCSRGVSRPRPKVSRLHLGNCLLLTSFRKLFQATLYCISIFCFTVNIFLEYALLMTLTIIYQYAWNDVMVGVHHTAKNYRNARVFHNASRVLTLWNGIFINRSMPTEKGCYRMSKWSRFFSHKVIRLEFLMYEERQPALPLRLSVTTTCCHRTLGNKLGAMTDLAILL